jgi:hypothetical protein
MATQKKPVAGVKSKPAPAKRGPKPIVYHPLGGSLEEAIDNALAKKKLARGWPRN